VKRLFLLVILFFVIIAQAQNASCDIQGTVTRESYGSGILGQTMYYSVYTPPCYESFAAPYPVIYLMHGSNDDDNQWSRLGLPEILNSEIQAGRMPPLIVVMPFGNVIANRNQFDYLSWNNIFLSELMPDAEEKYQISTEQAFRAIGGISRGGFWAYQIAFANPELFIAVGGHSAFFDDNHAPAEVNPVDLALTQEGLETMRLWLDRGMNDFAADGLDLMDERLTDRGLAHEYTIYPVGEHNNDYWIQHVAEYLRFYTATWQPTGILPTPAVIGGFATNTPLAPQATATEANITFNSDALYLPVVGFPSLQTSVSLTELQAIASSELNPRLLILDESQMPVHPDTRRISLDSLRDSLWNNRDWFALLPLEAITPEMRILFVDDMPVLDIPNYPFAGQADSLTRFTLSGVTALTRQTRVVLDENSVQWAGELVAPYVQSSDIFHMSNEVSFVEGCPTSPDGTYLGGGASFCSNPSHFELFTMLDVDVVELTGNHNNDYGYEAYGDTLAFYRENDIATVGGGDSLSEARAPYIIESNGTTIAMLACNYVGPYYALVNEDENMLGGARGGAASCDWEWLDSAIPALAAEVDILIVSLQYLEVEDYLPTNQQRVDFRHLADLGADVVMGSQAHKPQTFEFYTSSRGELSFLHYGLGNLFFDQPWWGNMRFFMDTLYISEGQIRGIELYPGIIDDLARPRLMTAEERENFLFFMFNQQNGF
jgi:enterochelin esterase-like enzyme